MIRGIAVGLLAVALGAAEVHAQQFVTTGRDTLRKLTGVEVLVEPLQPELEQAGLSGTAIRADVERQLRVSNIPVYVSQMTNPDATKPYLYVHVSGLPVARQGFALAVRVEIRQTLRSAVTNSNIVNAMTWDQQLVLFALASSDLQGVQREIQTLVEQFVRDWRAVH